MRTITFILLLFPTILFGQNFSETEIIKDYCERAESFKWKNKSVVEITNKLSEIAIEIRQDHLETINKLKKEIKADKPALTDTELDKVFSIKLIESLVNECDSYIHLMRNLVKPCPKENKSLDIIVKKIDSIIKQNQNLSYSEQLSTADNQIFNIVMDNEKQVNKDYNGDFASLADDVGIYLLHKSKHYYKAYLISNTEKMFN